MMENDTIDREDQSWPRFLGWIFLIKVVPALLVLGLVWLMLRH
jgi:hypothetical protein